MGVESHWDFDLHFPVINETENLFGFQISEPQKIAFCRGPKDRSYPGLSRERGGGRDLERVVPSPASRTSRTAPQQPHIPVRVPPVLSARVSPWRPVPGQFPVTPGGRLRGASVSPVVQGAADSGLEATQVHRSPRPARVSAFPPSQAPLPGRSWALRSFLGELCPPAGVPEGVQAAGSGEPEMGAEQGWQLTFPERSLAPGGQQNRLV